MHAMPKPTRVRPLGVRPSLPRPTAIGRHEAADAGAQLRGDERAAHETALPTPDAVGEAEGARLAVRRTASNASGTMVWTVSRPWRRAVTRPTSRSLPRCHDTSGCDRPTCLDQLGDGRRAARRGRRHDAQPVGVCERPCGTRRRSRRSSGTRRRDAIVLADAGGGGGHGRADRWLRGTPPSDQRRFISIGVDATCPPGAVSRRGGQSHRDAQPAAGARGEREGSVVGLGDAPDDRQAEADAGVVGADAFGAALERLDERGDELRRRASSPVFSTVSTTRAGARSGRDPHGAAARAGCGRSRCARGSSSAGAAARVSRRWASTSPTVSIVTPRSSARGRSVSAASSAMSDRSTRSRGEGALVGAAEQQQRLGEVDRPGVDGVEALDELAGVAARDRCGRRRAASA